MAHQLSSTIFKALDILNDGDVHAGSDIAETLGISRTAVWKIIQRLKKYNIGIHTQRQGYRLDFPLVLLDKKKIGHLLEKPGIALEIFEEVPSTNDYLASKASLKTTSICLAEYQSRGRGRLGRQWLSPFGRNIYCSFTYVFNRDVSEVSGLSLVVALLAAQALESLEPALTFAIKWPNDIYLQGQKMGGILVNLVAEAHGNSTAIVGIGLNINMKGVGLEGIDRPWTSLEHALNEKRNRNLIIARILQSVLKGMDVFHERGMGAFLPEWERYDLLANRKVSLNTGAETIHGLARGINSQGCLLLELSSGDLKAFSCGDVLLLNA